MDVGFTSTHLLASRIRDTVQGYQSELSRKQVELSTGKKFDVGLDLGSLSSHLVAARRQIASIDQVKTTNALLDERMTVMQQGFSNMVTGAQYMVDQLSVELSANLDRAVLQRFGSEGIADLSNLMNSTYRGEYVYSGINTDVPALNDYDTAPRTAVRNAFQLEFGMLPDDPAVSTIDPAAMSAFLEGAYADLFDDAGWQADWTGASSRNVRVKYSLSDVTEVPGNGNDGAMRKLAAGYAIMAELGGSAIPADTMDTVINFVVTNLSQGIAETGAVQSQIGVVQNRLSIADERLDYQKNLLNNAAANLEEVDSFEVAMRITELLTSIEASYAATTRIQGLSIMDYL